jgi:serine/threonine-protein kinase
MGVVWRVRHIQTNQPFALKTLRHAAPHNKQVLRRLLHEARATAAVQSRNVVRIVDVKPDYVHKGTDLPFIVMELLEGQSFADYLDTKGPIEPPELLWIMRQVCHGLMLAHERGIVHRDLKPLPSGTRGLGRLVSSILCSRSE